MFFPTPPATLISFFFFNDPAPTEISTLSLHDALPIYLLGVQCRRRPHRRDHPLLHFRQMEEHTSELQSQSNLVCRLLLEKKKNTFIQIPPSAKRRPLYRYSDTSTK